MRCTCTVVGMLRVLSDRWCFCARQKHRSRMEQPCVRSLIARGKGSWKGVKSS